MTPRSVSAAARIASSADERDLVGQWRPLSIALWHSMQWAAHGSASSRAAAMGSPQRRHAPKRAVLESREGRLDELELLFGAVAQGEVALLLEHLAGRGGLRAVGHLAGRLDDLAQFSDQASALGVEGGARTVRSWASIERMYAAGVRPHIAIYSYARTDTRR